MLDEGRVPRCRRQGALPVEEVGREDGELLAPRVLPIIAGAGAAEALARLEALIQHHEASGLERFRVRVDAGEGSRGVGPHVGGDVEPELHDRSILGEQLADLLLAERLVFLGAELSLVSLLPAEQIIEAGL